MLGEGGGAGYKFKILNNIMKKICKILTFFTYIEILKGYEVLSLHLDQNFVFVLFSNLTKYQR